MSRKDDGGTGDPRFIGLSRDVTVRKTNELKVEESENHLRAIIEAEPACIKIVDASGNLIQMNRAGLQMIQADSLEQVLNSSVVSLVVQDHKQAFLEMHDRVLAGESMSLQFEIIGLKGRRLWLETYAVPLQHQGAFVQLAVTHDITERKQNETSLRVAAVAFESREGMLISDANNVILRVNSAFTRMTGYSQDEVIGKTPQMLKSNRHDETFYQAMWAEIERSGAWQGEIWDRRKSGEIYPKWLSISVVRDGAGQVTHYI
jgi:PAS domain S-box-containing protein